MSRAHPAETAGVASEQVPRSEKQLTACAPELPFPVAAGNPAGAY
jgi:hypothetical protein